MGEEQLLCLLYVTSMILFSVNKIKPIQVQYLQRLEAKVSV